MERRFYAVVRDILSFDYVLLWFYFHVGLTVIIKEQHNLFEKLVRLSSLKYLSFKYLYNHVESTHLLRKVLNKIGLI